MSKISATCGGQNRATFSEPTKTALLDAVARRASRHTTPELMSMLGLHRHEISYLRNRRPGYFGWERLLYAAEKIGVRIDLSISEAA